MAGDNLGAASGFVDGFPAGENASPFDGMTYNDVLTQLRADLQLDSSTDLLQNTTFATNLIAQSIRDAATQGNKFRLKSDGSLNLGNGALTVDTNGNLALTGGLSVATYLKLHGDLVGGTVGPTNQVQWTRNSDGVLVAEVAGQQSGASGSATVLALHAANPDGGNDAVVWAQGNVAGGSGSNYVRARVGGVVKTILNELGGSDYWMRTDTLPTFTPYSPARMYLNTNATVTAGPTSYVPTAMTVDYDPGSRISGSPPVFVCPTGGYYRVTVQAEIQNNTGGANVVGVGVSLNGTALPVLSYTSLANTVKAMFNATATYNLAAGNTLGLGVYIGTGGGLGSTITGGSNTQGSLIEVQRVA